jgi:hypothetical protein
MPSPPPGTLQELARIASHAIPQPLQFWNDPSLRPSEPGATERPTQVLPQQRWVAAHSGRHVPPPPPPSRIPPSPVAVPMQVLLSQYCPARHVMPQPPQFASSSIVETQAPLQQVVKSTHAGLHVSFPLPAHAATRTPNESATTAREASLVTAFMSKSPRKSRALTSHARSQEGEAPMCSRLPRAASAYAQSGTTKKATERRR